MKIEIKNAKIVKNTVEKGKQKLIMEAKAILILKNNRYITCGLKSGEMITIDIIKNETYIYED